MPTPPCPDKATLQRLHLGQLNSKDQLLLESHLEQCPACAKSAETLNLADSQTDTAAKSLLLPSSEGDPPDVAKTLDTQAVSALSRAADSAPTQRKKIDFLAPPQEPDELGRLGGYRVLKLLGAGGMGVVFKGEDVQLRRLVALKVMHPRVAAKRDAKARFLREARATAALTSDHIVQIYQVGEERGVPFLAMQYLSGSSLEGVLSKRKKLKPVDVARIGKEVAWGLAAAHEKGLVHRDIKPDNIWIEAKTLRAKILDFGLARDLGGDEGLTQSGTVLGTPRYMAPEQVTGGDIDFRCDLFSLGSMLYHLVSGKTVFRGEGLPALLYAIVHTQPEPLHAILPGIDPAFERLIMRLLSKDPAERPESAELVAKELGKIEQSLRTGVPTAGNASELGSIAPIPTSPKPKVASVTPPPRVPPMAWIGAGAAAFAFLLGILFITIRDREGNETTLKVNTESVANIEIDAAPGSQVTIRETPSPSTNLATEQTEEELLFPPIEKWLEGRKILTVAQDGSAMFTTIAAALEAQRNGEVVEVLDKGPYIESIRWEERRDVGLISRVGTVVVPSRWDKGWDVANIDDAHRLRGLGDFRLHGFNFGWDNAFQGCMLAVAPPPEVHYSYCIEECVFLPPINHKPGRAFLNLARPNSCCLRNNVFSINLMVETTGHTVVRNNWFFITAESLGGVDEGGGTLSTEVGTRFYEADNDDKEPNINFRHNALSFREGIQSKWKTGSGGSRMRVQYESNTLIGSSSSDSMDWWNGAARDVSVLHNVLISESMACGINRPAAVEMAKATWKIHGNYSPGTLKVRKGRFPLPLVAERSPDIRLLSTDPLDSNFMRVDPTSITVPPGEPFPGALPPGPAPPEGDWFTRLQDRWREALQYVPEESRAMWTRPIELPKINLDPKATSEVSLGPSRDGNTAWRPTPPQQTFLHDVGRLSVHEQGAAVAKKLQEINPGFDGKFVQKIEGGKLTGFEVTGDPLVNIWPVRALGDLRRFRCAQSKVADLSPLAGLELNTLDVGQTSVVDLSPLERMPLKSIDIEFTKVADLTPLAKTPIQDIDAHGSPIVDLSPLSGTRLISLNVAGTQVTDISPLRGMPLKRFLCDISMLSDLSPLVGGQLEYLQTDCSLVSDFRFLEGMPISELCVSVSLFCDAEENLLRRLPISRWKEKWDDTPVPTNEFWGRIAARRAKAEEFASRVAKMPGSHQIETVTAQLREINQSPDIFITPIFEEGEVVELTVRTPPSNIHKTGDATPLLGLTKLRKLTLDGAPPSIDLSVLSRLPIEELNCSNEQVTRNSQMLSAIPTLRTINGQPASTAVR